ncbi:four helix bundle protein [Echinicola jeungdonensis]|uniref:Four helix bundle protein n=1 Tax=Echinicola jeungdonensis TaxID=709343 RepID=A0ABV5J4Q4_9BACT|nr:four helix bundle protein [Echinicola jeungdonensis]MDN3668135.1 four helix bundle protein [Echinicola jeungdonensis]
MNHYTYSFENLEVWKIARGLKKEIYLLTKQFPEDELNNLTSQIKRAIGSVTANLVEGSGRTGDKDRARFTNTAYTSALEVLDHIITAFDMEYISEDKTWN